MPENEERKLNPQIVDVEIGIRSLRKITIYPLSMADQLKLTDVIVQAAMASVNGGQDMAVPTFILQMLQENVAKILSMVTDEDEKLMSDISNLQAVAIADVLFEVNYGAVAKNFKSLSEKLKAMFQPERPLPQSVNGTDTGLKTSTESPTEKAE
uniref:Uncharacterized protein n=1 Tax=viral metagenome TaxID=1070528 RepID=A0A6M3IX72_9ZZZZ